MNCKKCNKVMRLKYVMNPDGTFKMVWVCPDCKEQQHALGRKC